MTGFSERDEKIIAAMVEYDAAAVGTSAQTQAGVRLEKAAAGISERDYWRIKEEYERRTQAAGKETR